MVSHCLGGTRSLLGDFRRPRFRCDAEQSATFALWPVNQVWCLICDPVASARLPAVRAVFYKSIARSAKTIRMASMNVSHIMSYKQSSIDFQCDRSARSEARTFAKTAKK
jgi:hypothetical protein